MLSENKKIITQRAKNMIMWDNNSYFPFLLGKSRLDPLFPSKEHELYYSETVI